MTSIRSIVKQTSLFIACIIVITLVITVFFMPAVQRFSAETSALYFSGQTLFKEMDLPTNVLTNVSGAAFRDGEENLSPTMREAFNRNKALLSETVIIYDQVMHSYYDNIQRVQQLVLYRNNDVINRLIINLERLLELDRALQNLEVVSIDDSLYFQQLRSDYNEMAVLSNNIGADYELLRQHLIGDAVNVIITLVVLLILMLLGYMFFSYLFVNNTLKFIIHSFRHLEEKAYDFNDLPKLKPNFQEEREIISLVKEVMDERKYSSDVKDLLMERFVIDDVIEGLFEMVSDRMGVDRVGIAFVDYGRKKIIAEYGVSNYKNILLGPGYEVDFEETSLTKIFKTKGVMISDNLNDLLMKNPESHSLKLIVNEGIQSNIAIPLLMSGTVFGVVFFSSVQLSYFNASQVRLAQKIIYEITGLLNRAYFTKVILTKLTTSFSEIVDRKDNDTGEHIERMVKYSVVLARALRDENHPDYPVTNKFILELERNVAAHDIGKVAVPDSILKKPGKLSEDEWTIMKTHPTVGADIFKNLRVGLDVFEEGFFRIAEDLARYHHEKWDGSGYPEGLSGEAIPLAARITAIADVFDALSSKRVYKEAFSFERAADIIKEGKGSHFDPYLVTIFEKNLEKFYDIYKVGR